MGTTKKDYVKPEAEMLEFDYTDTVVASGKNPAQCTEQNPGHCDLGSNPGHGCSNNGNPGNGSYGGKRKQPNGKSDCG